MLKLYYIMDPMCGWCYGFGDIAKKLFKNYGETLDMEILPAGFRTGDKAAAFTSDRKEYIRNANKRITELSGKEFGEGFYTNYFDKGAVMDSYPSSKAIISAKHLAPKKAYELTSKIQEHFCYLGDDMRQDSIFYKIAKDLDIEGFEDYYNSQEAHDATLSAFKKVSDELDVHNYPTLVLQKDDTLYPITVGYTPYDDIVASLERYL